MATGSPVLQGRHIRLEPLQLSHVEGLAAAAAGKRKILVVEMNAGQMVEDVKRTLFDLGCLDPVSFYGRQGGVIPTPEEIADVTVREFAQGGAR
jgi:2-oxoglutarate ferredoxin oxidoreductase subunit alpha